MLCVARVCQRQLGFLVISCKPHAVSAAGWEKPSGLEPSPSLCLKFSLDDKTRTPAVANDHASLMQSILGRDFGDCCKNALIKIVTFQCLSGLSDDKLIQQRVNHILTT